MASIGSSGPEKVGVLFCDGACVGNPGPGGWAALIRFGGEERIISGREPATTNNRMELTAAIRALEALPPGARGTLTSDSEYVVKGLNEWLPSWKAKGWRTGKKKPVLNADLWRELDALAAERRVAFEWTRGHVGHPENERVDGLAEAEAAKAAEEIGWTRAARFGFSAKVA